MVNDQMYQDLAREVKEKKNALEDLKDANAFLREIGKPDIIAERTTLAAEREIRTLEDALKKRNVKV